MKRTDTKRSGMPAPQGLPAETRRKECGGFLVQSKQCKTCIYKPGIGFDIAALEAEVADKFGGFRAYRTCHHSRNVCCRGFWNRHKNKFQLGQIAQRLGFVKFVDVDTLKA